MNKVIFHPDAIADAASAVEFYNNEQKSLGKRFISAVEDGAARIRIDPLLYPYSGRRRQTVHSEKFPFYSSLPR